MESKSDTVIPDINKSGGANTIGGIDRAVLKTYGFYAIIIIIIMVILYACYRVKETYMTESVRSDSDRNDWDLRKMIYNYLKKQDNYLKRISSDI